MAQALERRVDGSGAREAVVLDHVLTQLLAKVSVGGAVRPINECRARFAGVCERGCR